MRAWLWMVDACHSLNVLENTLSITTEFSVSRMKEQITQRGAFRSEVFRLAKSEGKFALPARCCRLSWYLQRAIRKDVKRGRQKTLLGIACWSPGRWVGCLSQHMYSFLTGWWPGLSFWQKQQYSVLPLHMVTMFLGAYAALCCRGPLGVDSCCV